MIYFFNEKKIGIYSEPFQKQDKVKTLLKHYLASCESKYTHELLEYAIVLLFKLSKKFNYS